MSHTVSETNQFNINEKKLRHLGIILDGNRRWATQQGLSQLDGHTAGAEALRRTVTASIKNNIEYLTVYVFSTENWRRTEEEVGFLMKLAYQYIEKYLIEFKKNNIRVSVFGDLDTIKDKKLVESLCQAVEQTKNNTGLKLNLCFNYGGRLELVTAIKNIIKAQPAVEDIDEKFIEQYLYSAGQPDPDMVVRTSGEQRLSNFLPWQSTYSELYFMDMYWPDFDEAALDDVIEEFQKRQRRFGQ